MYIIYSILIMERRKKVAKRNISLHCGVEMFFLRIRVVKNTEKGWKRPGLCTWVHQKKKQVLQSLAQRSFIPVNTLVSGLSLIGKIKLMNINLKVMLIGLKGNTNHLYCFRSVCWAYSFSLAKSDLGFFMKKGN